MDTIKSVVGLAKGLLNDPAKEQADNASDRTGGVVSTTAALSSQATAEVKYGFYPPKTTSDKFHSQGTDPKTGQVNPQKLVELAAATWKEADTSAHLLLAMRLPEIFWQNNSLPAAGQSKYFTSVRCSFDFEVQANAATGCSGSIIIVYKPYASPLNNTRTFGTFPLYTHVILNIGCNTSARLHVPYVNDSNYAAVNSADLGHIEIYVWSPLIVPTNTPNDISITVFGSISDLDFQCPRPVAQMPHRNRIDIAEGVGAMNISNSRETRRAPGLALCGESVAVDNITVGMQKPIDDLRDLMAIPLVVGLEDEPVFHPWAATAGVGASLFQANFQYDLVNSLFHLIGGGYQYCRGSIIFTMTVYNSTLHKGRAKICFFPFPVNRGTPAAFTNLQANNAFYVVHDIGLNSAMDLVVPFSSDTWLKRKNGVFGRLDIFVSSRLSVTPATSPAVNFVLTVRAGSDFEFVVPADWGLMFQTDEMGEGSVSDNTGEAAQAAGLVAPEEMQIKDYIDEKEAKTGYAMVVKKVNIMRANHMSVQSLFGRAQFLGTYATAADTNYVHAIPLPTGGFYNVLKCFCYYTGDLNIHVYNSGTAMVMVAHCYNDVTSTTMSGIAALGAYGVPAKNFASITVPFYFDKPVRNPRASNAMGSLLVHSLGAGTIYVWVSFANLKLFQPVAVPRMATLATWIKDRGQLELEDEMSKAAKQAFQMRLYDAPLHHMPKEIPAKFTALQRIMEETQDDGGWIRDLVEEGVEPNPGPLVEAQVVQIDREDGKVHYGILKDHWVVHCPEGDITLPLEFMQYVDFVPYDEGVWKPTWNIEVPGIMLDQLVVVSQCGPLGDITELGYNEPHDVNLDWIIPEIRWNVAERPRPHNPEENFQHLVLNQLAEEAANDAWVRDLTREGVESNPGPLLELVYKNRGLYKHYGLRHNGQVCHMSSDNILKAAVDGVVPIVLVDDDEEWIAETEIDISTARMAAIERSRHMPNPFSATNNCETWAKRAIGIKGFDQARALTVFGMILASVTGVMAAGQAGTADAVKNGIRDACAGTKNMFSSLGQSVKAFMAENVFDAIKCDITRTLFKLVLRTVCYGICFCSSPGLLTGAAVATLIAMDLASVNNLATSTKALLEGLLSGSMDECGCAIADLIYDNAEDKVQLVRIATSELRDFLKFKRRGDKLFGQGPVRDFNDASLAMKNFEYWFDLVKRFFAWLKTFFCADEQGALAEWFEGNRDTVAKYCVKGDKLLLDYMEVNNKRDARYQAEVKTTVKELTILKSLAIRAQCTPACISLGQILSKLQNLALPPVVSQDVFRFEPIGVWLSGSAGCGKSMLATMIMKHTAMIIEKTGLDPKTVYTEASGSEFYDGYRNQFFHIIDDAGQCRDEEDLKLMCQVISSVPFTVPLADLAEKGTQYSSKIVIATTNRGDFTTVALTDKEALERRFPFKLSIRVAEKYWVDGSRMLDVKRAQEDGSLERGHCWEVRPLGSSCDFRIFDLKAYAGRIAGRYEAKLITTRAINGAIPGFSQFPTSRCDIDTDTVAGSFAALRHMVNDRAHGVVDAQAPVCTFNVLNFDGGQPDHVEVRKMLTVQSWKHIASHMLADAVVVTVHRGNSFKAALRQKLAQVTTDAKNICVITTEHSEECLPPITREETQDERVTCLTSLVVDESGEVDLNDPSYQRAQTALKLWCRDTQTPFDRMREEGGMNVFFGKNEKKESADELPQLETTEEALVYLRSVDADWPFESGKTQQLRVIDDVEVPKKVDSWFVKKWNSWKRWYTSHKNWLQGIAIMGTIISAVAGVYTAYAVLRGWTVSKTVGAALDAYRADQAGFFAPVEEAEGRAYGGGAGAGMNAKKKKVVLTAQGFAPTEYAHLYKRCVSMTCDNGKTIYGMTTGSKEILTYKHYFKMGGKITALQYDGLEYLVEQQEQVECTDIEYQDTQGNELGSDAILLRFPKLPFNMKTALKFIAEPHAGQSGVLMYGGHVAYTQGVENVQIASNYGMNLGNKTLFFSNGITYQTRNCLGMCGGIVIQKQNGAWKIIGMHHAGDGMMHGNAFQIKLGNIAQGVVVGTKKNDKPVFNPTKTKLKKSPLYGLVEPKMGPAPLHPKDTRIEIEIPNLVKKAASKYRVDVFEPNEENFSLAYRDTATRLFAATGRCGLWTMEQALSGNGENPVDMTTSPGRKYVEKGLTKKDLVIRNDAGILVPTPGFRRDVEECMNRIVRGEAQTNFTATLKDELRPDEKIAQGGARCIEACEFDFVVCHRMILGELFQKIYDTEMTTTGIAVGCNAYTDFHLFDITSQKHWYAIDYSRYDGSLSEGLMREGINVLADCHEDADLVKNLLEPVVISTHYVADEIWTVKGGMPSGSPCTSVLNSVCNLLVVKTACLTCGVPTPQEIQIITYGDDVLMTTPNEFDDESLPEEIKKQFGMEATSADKKSSTLAVHPLGATFLKRHFRYFPGTRFVTGVLDINSMTQKIQWCHGLEAFAQQWESFTQELVLHGRETYESTIKKCEPRLDKYKIYTPNFDRRYREVYQSIFV